MLMLIFSSLLIGGCLLAHLVIATEIKGYHTNNNVYKESPPMILFSIYMGDILHAYDHLELTIDSMRYNPQIDYVLINIITPLDPAVKALNELLVRLKVPNFRVVSQSMNAFSSRIKDRIHTDIPFEYGTKLWARKMCDFKPTLAFLYSELIQPKHKYWGYVDNDLIWGNINAYADWFNGPNQYQAVYSVMWTPGGYFSVFENAPWSIRLFIDQKSYFVSLLKNASYHNLDEGGLFASHKEDNRVDDSMMRLVTHFQEANPGKIKVLRNDFTKHYQPMVDKDMAASRFGPVLWHQGSLKLIHGSLDTQPMRELLLFHWPLKHHINAISVNYRHEIIEDMKTYGYLLPNFIPLFTRHICHNVHHINNMSHYRPYRHVCFAQPNAVHLIG